MKTPLLPQLAFLLLALAGPLRAGESGLTVTWQPLSGLGAGGIVIAPVTCHDWYAAGGVSNPSVGLISAVNVPPTNHPKMATADLNLASVHGIRFSTGDLGAKDAARELRMDVTKFRPPGAGGIPGEDIVRASLECLRLCLSTEQHLSPLTVEGADGEKAWIAEIVRDFNAHDRKKPFFTRPE